MMITQTNILHALSPEERQLLGLIRQGLTDTEISIVMHIHEDEIDTIHSSAAQKINAILTQHNNTLLN